MKKEHLLRESTPHYSSEMPHFVIPFSKKKIVIFPFWKVANGNFFTVDRLSGIPLNIERIIDVNK